MRGMLMYFGIVILANVVHFSDLAGWGFWGDLLGIVVGGVFVLAAMDMKR